MSWLEEAASVFLVAVLVAALFAAITAGVVVLAAVLDAGDEAWRLRPMRPRKRPGR